MFEVIVSGATPQETVRSLQMLSAAGFSPVKMELGLLTYRVMDAKDLERFCHVQFPGTAKYPPEAKRS